MAQEKKYWVRRYLVRPDRDKLWPRLIELLKGGEPSSRESLRRCLEES